MTNNKAVTIIIVTVVITAAFCYVLYLEEQKKKLLSENDLLKNRINEDKSHNTNVAVNNIINISSIPQEIKKDFKETVEMPVTKVCSFTASLERAKYLKDYIENKDGYKMFYHNNTTYKREKDIHFLYGLTWYKTPFDVNKEVNNGRGAVDFKVSHGSTDQTLIEFKLASNTHIKRNLEKQTQIYLKANKGAKKVIVIVVLNESEAKKMNKILTDLKLHGKKNIVLIDARKDNKASASAA